ncbi:MAG: large repetitive protein [Acidobacteriota bacterium]|nr:large repetitive protein [Acidobacteriota bacterium]
MAAGRPELDQFGSKKAGRTIDPSALAQRVGNIVKPGFKMQIEQRLGVPTFVWANPATAAAHIDLIARPSGNDGPQAAAARGHLGAYATLYGLNSMDVSTAQVAQVHDTGKGAVIVKFRQSVDGIEIFREEANVLMTRGLDAVAISGYISSQSTPAARGQLSFSLDAKNAATNALQDLTAIGINASDLVKTGSRDGYDYYTFAASDGVTATEPVRIRKVYYHQQDGLEPGYYVEVIARTPGHATIDGYDVEGYAYVISAIDGSILFRHNLVADAHADGRQMKSNASLGPGGFTYRVWADPVTGIPYDEPSGNGVHPKINATPDGVQYPFVSTADVTLPNYPFSMNDPWLAPGATETVGNNADAYMDLFNPDGYTPVAAPADPATGDFRAQITSAGQFLHTHTPDSEPKLAEPRQGSLQQMFYNVNFLHDWYYDAGFNEASGNAQLSNFGRGGAQNDRLKAEGQDVSGRNNANMLTPADGVSPRMQMYLFDSNAIRYIDVLSPPAAAGQRTNVGTGQFGAQVFDITNTVFQPSPAHGCTAASFTGASGKIVLVDREPTATCSIGTKLNNAMAAGAAGFILVNLSTTPNQAVNVSGSLPTFTIPFLSMTWNDAASIKTQLAVPNVVTARMRRDAGIDRDGTIDNQVMFHEWGHYLSNRLVGNSAGLITQQSGGMGEGWGDFSAMMLTVRADDTATPSNATWNGAYALATYVTSGGANNGYYYGIRRVPYSTDMTKDPLTLQHIANGNPLPGGVNIAFGADGSNNAEVHNTGEVWATMLWEAYASLLRDTQGATPRLTFADAQNRMKQYLVAGLKMTPIAPTFLEARDAMLAAAYANDYFDYANFWQAFAKRGAGVDASITDRFTIDNNPVTENFTTPAELVFRSATLDDSVANCDADSVLDSGEVGKVTITLRNVGNGSLGSLTGTVSTTTAGVSFPNGTAISFPNVDPLGTTSASINVALAPGLAGAQSLDFGITFTSPQLAAPGNGSFSLRGNTNTIPASTATDTVEATSTQWTATTVPPTVVSGGITFTWGYPEQFAVKAVSALQHVWHGNDIGIWQDTRLTSPVFTVDGSGSFNLQFDHSFGFEYDGGGNYDGGVVEMSVNGGAFTDFGAPAYNGVILNYGGANNPNPLKGRNGFVQNSAGTIHTSLTQAIAPGSTVQVRFRIGADGGFGSTGWDIDNMAFTGVVETPFGTVVADTGCSVATSTSVSPSANPSPAGSSLTLYATVNSAAGAPNSGTVTFLDAGSPIGTGSVTAGAASFSTSSLAPGSHTLSARFEGITGYLPSTSPTFVETIGKIATATNVNVSVSRSFFSRPVTLTATVTGTTGTPTGSVTFYDGVNTLGTVGLSAGSAALTTSALATGSHNITASYVGNGTYAGSVSSIAVVLVETQKLDLSGEGRSDMVLQNSSSNTIAAWLMNGSTITSAANVATPTADWKVVATGDLEGDGKADLILQNSTTGVIAEWRMNGTSMISGANIATASTLQRIVGTWDFNHDGKADIVLQNTSTLAVAIWQMNGSSIVTAQIVATPAAGWKAIAAGNVGGDAIILQNTGSGDVARWLINGFTLAGGTAIGSPGATTKLVGLGDFNIDGIDDLLFQSTSTNAVTIWTLNSSAAVTGTNTIATPAAGVNVLGAADYDANGRSDILLQTTSSNAISMWQTDGVTLLSGAVVATPVAGWKPVVN